MRQLNVGDTVVYIDAHGKTHTAEVVALGPTPTLKYGAVEVSGAYYSHGGEPNTWRWPDEPRD